MTTIKENQTLAEYIAKHALRVTFVATHVSRAKNEFKTYTLHYAATVHAGLNGKAETFNWSAGYGCAVHQLAEKMRKLRFGSVTCPAGLRGVQEQCIQHIANQGDASKLRDQTQARQIMEWMLTNYQPDAASVLNSLKLDSQLGDQSFENFCGDCGYDTDSRTAETTWRACQESGRKLRGLVGVIAFDELLNKTESL